MIAASEIRMTPLSKGWEVMFLTPLGGRLCGYVRATEDGTWEAVDRSGRTRVANYWNRMSAAIALAELTGVTK